MDYQGPSDVLGSVRVQAKETSPFIDFADRIHSVLDGIDRQTKMIQRQNLPKSPEADKSPETELHNIFSGILNHASDIRDRLV